MSLARWDSFRELQNVENEMNRLFRRRLSGASAAEEALTTSQFAPPVDLYEDDSKLTIKMDVPDGSFSRTFTLPASADTDNINATFENGTLPIEIAKRADSRAKQIKVAEGSSKGKKAAVSQAATGRVLFCACPVCFIREEVGVKI